MPSPSFARLHALLEHLPFPLDAVDRVNEAFQVRIEEGGDGREREVVELWTYCYVFWYFTVKSVQGNIDPPSDLDALVGTAFRRAIENTDTVQNPNRYASWVSVVCRNAFLNYRRKTEVVQSIEAEQVPPLAAEDDETHYDAGFVRQAIRAAIERLPAYLQEVARLHFLRGYTYPEIAAETGYGEGTIRTYRHRIVQKLREDDALAPFLDEYYGGSC